LHEKTDRKKIKVSMKLKDLKISAQLSIVITILLTMSVLIAVVAFYKSTKIEKYTNIINNHPYRVREAVFHIESNLQQIRMAQFEFYTTKTIRDKNISFQSIKASMDSITYRFYILHTYYLGPRIDINKAYMAFTAWRTALDNNLQLAPNEETDSDRQNILFTAKESVNRGILVNRLATIRNFAKAKNNELFALLYELNKSLYIQMRIMIIAILALTIFATYILLRNIRRPLKEITKAAQQFGDGNMNVRSIYTSKNEFGHMSSVFNAMADQIKIRSEETEKHSRELIIVNKELAFENEEKEKRATELGISNKELAAFSYSVSHDLRAPLRHINGFVDLLLSRFYDTLPEKARHYLDNIADSSGQMGLLIDALLKFSRIGRQEIQKTDLNMNDIVQEVKTTLTLDNKLRNIEWHIAELPHVPGDHALMQMVWTNLLNNAVKYTGTREKAIINIKAAENNGNLTYSVADNGVGFDMTYVHKLFGVFQRLHSNEEFEGIGIGLANVQHIISRHGGRTWAEAEIDKGATFYFTLPKYKET
jgi:signal transduction histidine kinase